MAGVTAVGQVMDSLAQTFDFAGSRTYPWAFFGKIDSIEQDGTFNVISGYIYDEDTQTAVPTLTACMPFCHAVVGDVVFVLVSNGQAVALDRKYGLTYTLSQSGTDIILTGSDGSSQSVVANDLTQMTGILPIANGGTGSSTFSQSRIDTIFQLDNEYWNTGGIGMGGYADWGNLDVLVTDYDFLIVCFDLGTTTSVNNTKGNLIVIPSLLDLTISESDVQQGKPYDFVWCYPQGTPTWYIDIGVGFRAVTVNGQTIHRFCAIKRTAQNMVYWNCPRIFGVKF